MPTPEQSAPLKYELEIDIHGIKFNDVNCMMVFRCPIQHTASYVILDVMMHLTHYNHFTLDIGQQIYPDVKVSFYLINPQKSRKDEQAGDRVKNLGIKNYKSIYIEANEFPGLDAKYIQCTMHLVNPVLYYLNNTNSYNVILTNKKGLDIITGYEKHLTSMFGSQTFEFIKIGEKEEENSFEYEQILIRLENDLIIPSWVIQNYKPFNSFGFYFHDDFRFDDKVKADINGYLINLVNKSVFPKIECLKAAKWGDVIMGNKFIDAIPIGDRYNQLGQENPSIIVKGSNIEFKFQKATGSTNVPQISVQIEDQEVEKGRKIKAIKSTKTETSKKPTEQTVIYAPDTTSVAVNRLNTVKKQLREDIEGIYRYYIRDSHIDFLQFGKLYNINPMTPQEYLYTPINIVNCFVRDTGRQPTMVHNIYYQMIKYKGESP